MPFSLGMASYLLLGPLQSSVIEKFYRIGAIYRLTVSSLPGLVFHEGIFSDPSSSR
jgi:hypothetical protein